jgi:DNA-binding transcriptional MerR regulator
VTDTVGTPAGDAAPDEAAPHDAAARGPRPDDRLDDPDYPALTMSQAAELLGVQAAFLRSLDSSGVLQPHRSPGGHRRYSRHQLRLAARVRGLLDDGHPLASAELIVGLQDELADLRRDLELARSDPPPADDSEPDSDGQPGDRPR